MVEFFLPNFEDLVDPLYDFVNDEPSKRRKDRWAHDRFAHELFSDQLFDGMLISKASISSNGESRILGEGGIRNFTRLDAELPIMGDCGAFSYALNEEPIYTVQEVIDYYDSLKFDYGVSLDHIAFVTIDALESAYKKGKITRKWWDGKTTRQIQSERFELSLTNAEKFLSLHSRQNSSFIPIGIAQGSNIDQYYYAVGQLIDMGYEHIALGAMVKRSDNEIVAVLEKIYPLIKDGIKLHIFGVARLSILPAFMKLGVTSVDSASPLRRAFLGTGEDNYWTEEGDKYAAIRVPHANAKRLKRGIISPKEVISQQTHEINSIEELTKLETRVLELLHLYDHGKAGMEETLSAVLDYDRLFGLKRNHESWYRRALEDQPWKKCDCSICKDIGIDVIIFRGNNRNRRRGFHNVKIFYDQFRQIIKNPSNLAKYQFAQYEPEGQQLSMDI